MSDLPPLPQDWKDTTVAHVERLIKAVGLDAVEPDYERAKRQMLNYLDDELFLGLESELEGIVDWNWLVKAVVNAAIGDKLLINPPTEEE